MELSILKNTGEDTGRKIHLSDEIFSIEPNDHALYLDVKQYLANQRQGTHKSKQRAEIAGSTRKIKKQKGTGTARAGSIKSPVFRGGGRMFGPEPRDYSFKLNKKVKVLARRSAISYKANSSNISVIEDFTFDNPKTKSFLKVISDLKLENTKTLFILSQTDKNFVLSCRNIQKVKVVTFDSINTYDLMNADKIVLIESAVEKVATSLQ